MKLASKTAFSAAAAATQSALTKHGTVAAKLEASRGAHEQLAVQVEEARRAVALDDTAALSELAGQILALELGEARLEQAENEVAELVEIVRASLPELVQARDAALSQAVQPLLDAVAKRLTPELGEGAARTAAQQAGAVVRLRKLMNVPGPFAFTERPIQTARELVQQCEELLRGEEPWLAP